MPLIILAVIGGCAFLFSDEKGLKARASFSLYVSCFCLAIFGAFGLTVFMLSENQRSSVTGWELLGYALMLLFGGGISTYLNMHSDRRSEAQKQWDREHPKLK